MTIAAAGLAAVVLLAVLVPFALRRASVPGEAPTARSNEVPRWLADSVAPTAAECLPDTPCASATACGVVVQAEAPCASAATCGGAGSRSRTLEGP